MAFKDIPCHNADEFWNKLNPKNPLGLGLDASNTLIFRGQASAKWGLKPSAFRLDSKLRSLFPGTEFLSSNTQVYNEWKIIGSVLFKRPDNYTQFTKDFS